MENNEVTKLQKENKIDKQKNNKILIMFLIIIIILLFLYIILDKFVLNKKIEQENPPLNNNDNIISYKMNEKELISFEYVVGGTNYNELVPTESNEGKYVVSYPVLEGNFAGVTELNNKIKNKVDDFLLNYKYDGEIITNDPLIYGENDVCYVDEEENGTKKGYCNINLLEYELTEIGDYIQIIEIMNTVSMNATGHTEYVANYVINKKTGEIISNEELNKSIENIDTIKTQLIKDAKEEFDLNIHFEKRYQEEYIAELTKKIQENDFIARDKNNFVFKKLPEWEQIEYIYNEDTNKWYSSLIF